LRWAIRSALPAASGAPPAPTTTRSACTRAAVTRSVWRWSVAATMPCVPAIVATRTIGVASAAVRQRLAARLVPASRPDAPSRFNGAASAATGLPSSRRPSSPVPIASSRPVRIEKARAHWPSNTSAMAIPPPSAADERL
jgi:hypothetical protein